MSLPAIDSPEAALAALEGAAMGMRDCNLPGSARTIDECRRVLAAALAVSRTLREALEVVPPDKLEALASLLDLLDGTGRYGPAPGHEAQDDLRRMARLSCAALRSGQAAKSQRIHEDDATVNPAGSPRVTQHDGETT